MRIIVVGSGIVGTATALELCLSGHEVTLVESTRSSATGSSFASGGLCGPSWAGLSIGSPTRLGGAGHHLGSLVLAKGQFWRDPLWVHRQKRALRQNTWDVTQFEARLLSEASHAHRLWLSQQWELKDDASRGLVYLWPHAKAAKQSGRIVETLKSHDANVHAIDTEDALAIEPGLDPAAAAHGGLHLPDIWNVSPRLLALQMRDLAIQHGLTVIKGIDITDIVPGASPSLKWKPSGQRSESGEADLSLDTRLPTEAGDSALSMNPVLSADLVILCTGPMASQLLAPLGIQTGIRPLWGITLSAQLRQTPWEGWLGPEGSVIDPLTQCVISRMGNRVRVQSPAFLRVPDTQPFSADLAPLYAALHRCFPGAAEVQTAQRWQGAFGWREGGLPWVGPSPAEGIWLNIGHGAHGVAWATGCARRLANHISPD